MGHPFHNNLSFGYQALTLFTMPRNLIKITCSVQNFFEGN